MKQPAHLKDLPRPYATSQRSHMCDSPASSFRSPKDEDHPFDMIDRRLKRDPGIPASLKGLVVVLLDYPANYEFRHMVQIIQDEEWCCEKTAYKYLNQLIDAGYIHPVDYRDVNNQWVRRYKVSELPVRPGPGEDLNPRTPLRVTGLQTSKCQSVGFPLGVKPGNKGKLDSELTLRKMISGLNDAIKDRTEARRIVGFAEWTELQAASRISISAAQKPGGKIYSTNKRSNGSKINLTHEDNPTLPGEGFFSFFDELPSTAVLKGAAVSTDLPVAPVTCGLAAPAKRKTAAPKTPAAPRVVAAPKRERVNFSSFALWAEDRRKAPTGEDLDVLLADFATAFPAAVNAIHEAGNSGTVQWAETMLANPLLGMVQELLGIQRWDYVLLRKWGRRLRRGTVSVDDLALLWRAQRAGSPLVAKAVGMWDQRGYRTNVPATHYATGVAIWPPDLSWSQLIHRIRRDATAALINALPQVNVPRMLSPYGETCRSSSEAGQPIEERFATWLLGDTHVSFFSNPDAKPYFLKLVESQPLLWAMTAPGFRRGMTDEIRDCVSELTAGVTSEEIQELVAETVADFATIPGGLTRTLLDSLKVDDNVNAVRLLMVQHAIADLLPDSQSPEAYDTIFDTESYRERVSYAA
jgi:hypothetical protein